MVGENAQALYDQGKFQEALDSANTELATTQDAELEHALHAQVAWCYYRRQEWDQALSAIEAAGDNQRARECHIYILAYAKGHTDDKKLSELAATMPDNINVGNALTIRARSANSTVEHEQVWALAESFAEKADVAEHNTPLANLLHNCARFFHDKARNRRDLKFALGLLKVAIAHYGETANWHHRAAAHFWLSHVYQKLTAIPEAFAAATASLQLWRCQCALEKDTKPFTGNLDNGAKRVIELTTALVAFAHRAHA